jgi:hypothetical protein
MAFDTLSYARRLKASGFSDQQAETLADATKELVTDQMVTKSFLESELDKLSMRLTIRMAPSRPCASAPLRQSSNSSGSRAPTARSPSVQL